MSQRWEYLTVEIDHRSVEGDGALITIRAPGSTNADRSTNERVENVLAELGAEGWELCGQTTLSARTRSANIPSGTETYEPSTRSEPLLLSWVFKRPA